MSKKKSTKTPKLYADRIARVREAMRKADLDGYLIFDRMDQIWLTGFTGEDGAALVTARNVVLLTDGRFDEAANIEAPWARKVLRKQRTPEVNAKTMKPYRLKRVGFDPGHMTVGEHSDLSKAVRPTKLVKAPGLISGMRQCKSAGEVDGIRASLRIAEQAFKKLKRWIKPGRTEQEMAARLEYEMRMLGAQGVAFPTICAVGANAALPHYEPGDVALKENGFVLFDWGAQYNWYTSDLTRVLWFGSIPRPIAKIFDIVREAHDRAIEAVRPGVTSESVDRVARNVITKAGYGKAFNHATGHGMGLNVHEGPRVGKGTKTILEPGMVITIEPGIYLPGKGGVRIEDDVLVTESGSEVLSELPIDLS